MAKEKIWSYLVHLGQCMWRDYGPGDGGYCLKTEPLKFEQPVWTEVSQKLKDDGCCNTILIDVAEGVQYESHPEIAAPGTWSKKRLSDEIDRLRSMGFKVYPKLNFATSHDKWMGIYSRMVSTPQYYTFCKDVIDEVSELFGNPELFHLGMDEECYSVQTKSPMCIIRNGDLLWHDINYLFSLVEAKGARPWIWADYVWHSQASKADFVKNMSKDVLCSNWYYGNWEHTSGFWVDSMEGYRTLEEHGFEQLPAGGNYLDIPEYCEDNMKITVDKCTQIVSPDKLAGFMMTTWEMTTSDKKQRLLAAADDLKDACIFYNSKK